MNDEIKNILDEFMNFDFNSQWERIEINEYERNILRDYITNLQQENNNLKTSLDESQEVVIDLQQRIDKAIEYIDSLWLDKDGFVLNIRERLHFILRGKDK